jgi:hypothetical protein
VDKMRKTQQAFPLSCHTLRLLQFPAPSHEIS